MTFKLQLPEEIGSFWANQLEKVRILIVLELYKQKKISSGKAEQLADLHTWNMLDILTKHDFPLDCTAKKILRKICEPLNRYPPNDCCRSKSLATVQIKYYRIFLMSNIKT